MYITQWYHLLIVVFLTARICKYIHIIHCNIWLNTTGMTHLKMVWLCTGPEIDWRLCRCRIIGSRDRHVIIDDKKWRIMFLELLLYMEPSHQVSWKSIIGSDFKYGDTLIAECKNLLVSLCNEVQLKVHKHFPLHLKKRIIFLQVRQYRKSFRITRL